MRYAVAVLPLDFARGNIVEAAIKGFRRVLGSTRVEKQSGLLIPGVNGSERNVVLPALIVEFDPQGVAETHRFVGVLAGRCIESEEIGVAKLEYAVAIVAPGHPPLVIYRVPGLLAQQKINAIEVVPD